MTTGDIALIILALIGATMGFLWIMEQVAPDHRKW